MAWYHKKYDSNVFYPQCLECSQNLDVNAGTLPPSQITMKYEKNDQNQ